MGRTFSERRFEAARRFVADAYAGADAIKDAKGDLGFFGSRAFFYLPPTEREASEEEKFANEPARRTKYRTRLAYGVYDNFFRSIIDDVVGVMQTKAPTVQFRADGDLNAAPDVLRDLYYFGTSQNDGFSGLKQRVNFGQTLFGRYGLLLDVATDAEGLNPRFVVSEYPAASILDGEETRERFGTSRLRWILCDESAPRFNPRTKSRDWVERYRLCALDGRGVYYQALFDGDASAKWNAFDLENPNAALCDRLVYPSFKGRTLDFVPFTVANVDRLGVEARQAPPYWDVARIAVANYQIDSIYKTALWNFASPTLVVKNVASTGAPLYLGDAIFLNGASGDGADAALLETTGAGLAEIRQAKEEIKTSLRFSSIRDLFDGGGANASAKALSLRADSGTATIATIDKTGARALEEQLCFAAAWLGWSRDEIAANVKYEANASYLADDFQLPAIVSLMRENGATGTPLLSRRQLYRLVGVASGGVLDPFEDNEEQLLGEADAL